jgi:DNA polymerase III delta subunit
VAEAPDKPVYLITGSDRPKVDTALARLRGHFEAESIETVSALEASGSEAAALCNAGSLFGDARLVIVTEIDGLKADRGRRGGWKAADVESIEAYLASPAPATVLALVAEELRSSAGLWKACAKAGTVLAFDVDKKLAEWVGKRFHERGVRAEPEAVAALVALVGENPSALETEVDKIATWAAGEPVGEREVEALVAALVALVGENPSALETEVDKIATWAAGEPVGEREVEALVAANADVPIYELTEAWAVRDASRALGVSETIFEHESRQRRDTAARLAGSLGGHLNRLRALKRLAAEGVSSKEAASQLKLNPYYASKLYRQAEGFSQEELDEAVLRLAELDGSLKGQSRLAPDLEVQRTLVDLTRRQGAANADGR